jgi:beta-lactam-binding protein with PASTA domain
VSNSPSFKEFLRSRTFIINFILAVLIAGGILFGTLSYLDHHTHHGEEITVPDLHGISKMELDDFLSDKMLRYLIIDSVFKEGEPKGIVVGQNPAAMSKVKVDRTIYLTVNAMSPPSVKLPLLVDKSLRQAKSIIENSGLVLGNLEYIPDQCINCVLSQRVRGREIEQDTMLPKGTKIDLILGGGLSNEKILVPLLINLTRKQAIDRLKSSFLNLGAELYDASVIDDDDSLGARVFVQHPPYSATSWVQMGSSVDVEFTMLDTKIDTINVNFDSTLFRQNVPSEISDF